jgi:glycerophosphoryl diester phosphodiesterase
MKIRKYSILLVSVLLSLSVSAQGLKDEQKGVYRPYDFDAPRVDEPAPKGYEVFCLSHYGRHGSRFLYNEAEYDTLKVVLNREHLTEFGEKVRDKFNENYPLLKGRAADLTELGQKQHRQLARRMMEAYPVLFRNGSEVYAFSYDRTRCMMSMYSFLDELRMRRNGLDIQAEYNSNYLKYLRAQHPEPFDIKGFLRDNFDPQPLFKRLFTAPEKAMASTDPWNFAQEMYYYASHLEGAGLDDAFWSDVLSEDEVNAIHSVENEKFSYNRGALLPANQTVARIGLSHIIQTADEDIASGKSIVRLRFGHDTMIMSLMTLMGLSPFDGTRINSSDVPMASNIRFVFAKDRKGDVLVKVQYNESDVMSWTDWTEFRTCCQHRIEWNPSEHTVFEKNSEYNPMFISHRGLQSMGPENSFPAFKAAAERGAWAIETDFRMTADGHVVCIHDKTLDRTTDGKGPVADRTLAEIKSLKVLPVNTKTVNKLYDYSKFTEEELKVPTMDEYFEICNSNGCVAFVELKEDKGVIEAMIKAIEKYGMQDRCVISSGNLALLEAYRAAGGKELIHLIFAKPEQIRRVQELGNASVSFKYSDLSAEVDLEIAGVKIDSFKQLVDHMHSLGIRICFRAADTKEDALKMIEYGTDYMPSNVKTTIE